MRTQAKTHQPNNTRRVIVLVVVLGILGLAAANIHLVYTAISTQPECVPHIKTKSEDGPGYRVAKTAC